MSNTNRDLSTIIKLATQGMKIIINSLPINDLVDKKYNTKDEFIPYDVCSGKELLEKYNKHELYYQSSETEFFCITTPEEYGKYVLSNKVFIKNPTFDYNLFKNTCSWLNKNNVPYYRDPETHMLSFGVGNKFSDLELITLAYKIIDDLQEENDQ